MTPLQKAVRTFRNADTEYRRASNAGEQPRLNRAGTRYACAKYAMFCALDKELSTTTTVEGSYDERNSEQAIHG